MLLRSHPRESSLYSKPRTPIDRLGFQPTLQAIKAVNTLLEASPDTPSYMIGIRENQITRVPLMEAVELV